MKIYMSTKHYLSPKIGDRFTNSGGDVFEVINVDEYHTRGVVCLAEVLSLGYGPQFVLHAVDLFKNFSFTSSAQGRTVITSNNTPGKPPWAYLISGIVPSPLPPGESNEFFGITMNNIFAKCTCGIDSIGGGKHSDWCDKHEKEEAK